VENLTLPCFAKLNLYLQILNKRPDNYHNIKTVFERIGLCDTLTLKKRRDKSIKISCSDPLVPRGESNLCYRAAELLRRDFGKAGGVDIRITKRIPVGAGLAGGSSNAASTLIGLNKIWGLRLKKEQLLRYARKIGADVAFFLFDTPFALGQGRGDEIKPLRLQGVTSLWHILVVPRIVLSTAKAYEEWDRHKNFKLTKPRCGVKLLIPALRKGDTSLAGVELFNSLADVSEGLHPEIRRIRETLSGFGLKAVLMSGSGPAVMAIVPSRKEALAASRMIKKKERHWRVFVTRTV